MTAYVGFYIPQFASTTLDVAGGITAGQTTDIKLASVPSDIDISKSGIVCLTYANPINTSVAEWITYTSIDGTNGLQGVVRGAEGYTAKTHDNGCAIAWVVSKSHVNQVSDALTGVTTGVSLASATLTSPKINENVALTSSATELNLLDGVTALVTPTSTTTFTNKRSQKRVDSQTTTDTITPEISTYDIFVRSAQAHALVINNHSTSTPADGEMMEFIILGDATPRAITYGDKYVAKSGTALPSTTVASKCTKLLFQWRASLSQWDLLTATQEA